VQIQVAVELIDQCCCQRQVRYGRSSPLAQWYALADGSWGLERSRGPNINAITVFSASLVWDG